MDIASIRNLALHKQENEQIIESLKSLYKW